MPKAKLSQIASSWVNEDDNFAEKPVREEKKVKAKGENLESEKKKQTFSLRQSTIRRLWAHRVRTSKPISEIIDELVSENIPE